jgi:diadenylate cyclase
MSFLIPKFTDLVDIILIALLIYQCLLSLKRTGRFQILYAVLVIVLIYLSAALLNLKMISGVLNSLKNLWILILIILFQPEIREVLHKLTLSTVSLRGKTNYKKDFNGSLIDAISAMSFRRIGALIVIEKKRKLTEFIKAGEYIDSVMSLRLILSIFNVKSVLHDGAIIIRDDRIIAAKVVLPLSGVAEHKQKFGTRHLAALGISEVSDALAIVVSEQTGRVSVASDGIIQTDVAFEELMQIVTDATR